MKTNSQKLLPEHIPFYRRRIFWGIVFSLFFIFSTIIFFDFIDKNGGEYTRSFKQIFGSFSIAYGSTIFTMYGFKINAIAGYVSSILYFSLITYLTYKTFHRAYVSLYYPILIVGLYLTGLLPLLFLNGF